MDIFDKDILINDSGMHHSVIKDCLISKHWKDWTLPDFLEEMRRWPGNTNQLGLKKYGHQKIALLMRGSYQILAAWLELSLLGKEELRELLFYKELVPLRAAAKLMAASRFFIGEHLWDRIQGKVKNEEYWWSHLAHTPDHLWSAYEYSLCSKTLDDNLTGKAPKNKPSFLKEICNFNHLELKFIDSCNQAEAKICGLLSERATELWENHFQKLALKAMTENPTLSGRNAPIYCQLRQALLRQTFQDYREKIEEITRRELEKEHFNKLEQQFRRQLTQVYQTVNWACFYKFVMLEVRYLILFQRDRNLKAHYEQYLHEWFIYHDAMRNSTTDWQIHYLLSPDLDPVPSKVGRPPKDKRTTSNRHRGRPSKGQERKCNNL
jgi:hypothetical protein